MLSKLGDWFLVLKDWFSVFVEVRNLGEPRALYWGIPAAVLLFLCLLWLARRRAYLYSDERLVALAPLWVRGLSVFSTLFLFCGLALGVVAYAGPEGQEEIKINYVEQHRGCLVPDMSGSMGMVEDGKTRFSVVMEKGKELVKLRPGDAWCIVPFESSARLDIALPLTSEPKTVLVAMEEIANASPTGGTSMGDGMFYALAILLDDSLPEQDDGKKGELNVSIFLEDLSRPVKDGRMPGMPYVESLTRLVGRTKHTFMVIKTDAAYDLGIIDPLRVLEVAARFGVHVYILGIGFDYGTYPDLVRAVKRTGGDVFFAEKAGDLDRLMADINRLEKKRVKSGVLKRPRYLAYKFVMLSLILLGLSLIFWFILALVCLLFYRLFTRGSHVSIRASSSGGQA